MYVNGKGKRLINSKTKADERIKIRRQTSTNFGVPTYYRLITTDVK